MLTASEFCTKLSLSVLCLSSGAEQSVLQGRGSAPETSAQGQPAKLPAKLTGEARTQGSCRTLWSCGVPEPAALGLRKVVELVQFRNGFGQSLVTKPESPNTSVQVDAALWILSWEECVCTHRERGGRLVSRAMGRKALVARNSEFTWKSQGSINTDAAGFLCAWVWCLICSLSLSILGMRYCFIIFYFSRFGLNFSGQGQLLNLLCTYQSCGLGWSALSASAAFKAQQTALSYWYASSCLLSI